MTAVTFVIYPPGAGGNHLKNLLCLPGVFANSNDLDVTVYDDDRSDRAPGEVWCVGGRNLQDIFFDRLEQDQSLDYVLPAHFGEMWQYRDRIQSIESKRAVLIKIDQEQARRKLDQRQMRLGQCIHPYWLDEELTWCYQPIIYQTFFGIPESQCLELSMLDFWHHDMVDLGIVDSLESFLGVTMSRDQVRDLHKKWLRQNS